MGRSDDRGEDAADSSSWRGLRCPRQPQTALGNDVAERFDEIGFVSNSPSWRRGLSPAPRSLPGHDIGGSGFTVKRASRQKIALVKHCDGRNGRFR